MAQVFVCLTVCTQFAAPALNHIARAPPSLASKVILCVAHTISKAWCLLLFCCFIIVIVFVQGAAGPNSTTCQIEFNSLTCAGSCACAPPPPPPAPPIAAAPGCGFNTRLFSQQRGPPTGCTCCDAGFDYQDSCATQVISPQTLIHVTYRA